jgi:CRISPR type III-A-associated protein Csm2
MKQQHTRGSGGDARRRGAQGRDQASHERASPIDPARIARILARDAVEIDRAGQDIARRCADLPPTQIRNFYGPFVELRAELKTPQASQQGGDQQPAPPGYANALLMHRARIHYMAARDSHHHADLIRDWFSALIDAATKAGGALTVKSVEAICDLAEAVVAYHYAERSDRNRD